MAKWGEGDPRWIVEERPDATNVNNWHWTEKNASPWSQTRIKELFNNISVKTNEPAELTITSVEKCEGEACANNRKGKLIFFYEWDLTLNWEGKLKNGTDRTHKGTVKVPNLSEENDMSDLDIQIGLSDPDEEGAKLRDIMLKDGKSLVRSQLGKYVSGLKEEFSHGMILPRKGEEKPDQVKTLTSGFNKKINMAPVVSNDKKVGLKIDTTTIKQTHKFQCTAEEFYNALTRVEMVTAFTRGHVKLDPAKGGKFELFGGNITGVFQELVPNKKIVKTWRYKQWPDGHYSLVTIDIDQKDDHTEVTLTQSGVPSSEADVTRTNWSRYYWDAMKQAFGFGALLSGDL
ncbi:activator of 90 kDa heat shock protein ATPase homolog 1 [Anthonomus grandis grandis]|uniref:activator of 90 kDa heat shock protein ATPase homolog 1 n=1 Tax=Anthonomus grandis grandis TaxID=2921223 RepID=UPI00216511F0|nr:activator of 90 kDa heat shock protein ATPase homolog 1 [Anthonomus grandis grandis]XP_050300989.1 activator of 90 kDa heat shock protein ATPase homolog 1 [Anthonomus grandis grandis]